MYNEAIMKSKYEKLLPFLDERSRRLVLASDAMLIGRNGKSIVSRASGASRTTVITGLKELESATEQPHVKPLGRIRKQGGGRKAIIDIDAGIKDAIEEIVSPHTMGDPMKPLRWTSKSLRKICAELKAKGHKISHQTTGEVLRKMEYSTQQNKKTDEGGDHEDRDAQFIHINNVAEEFLAAKCPVISVDCKKKELIGNFKNAGSEWRPSGNPKEVKVYDFVDKKLGKAVPYGVYDIANNEGYVSVGINFDTASFAVATIRKWWNEYGKEKFSASEKILITADGGGSNSSRSRLWKSELQQFANETGLEISVCHFPPGTSKWNKIEHRLFSFISINWQAQPLTSLQIIVDLISATTTDQGLKVKASVDETLYKKGIKISKQQLNQIAIKRNDFHGEWNYTIQPNIE
jgi:hypothetical protein